MDDMVVDLPKYNLLREMYASKPVEPSTPGFTWSAKPSGSHPVNQQMAMKQHTLRATF